MKKLFLLLIAIIIIPGLMVFTGCDIVTGSGETQTFEMDFTNFTRIEISTGFDVQITRADNFYVSITVDKSLYEYLTLGKRGDTLLIGLKSNRTYTAAVRKAVINLPDLRRLELSSGASAIITGFSLNHAIDFELSGGSNLFLNPLQAGDAGFVLSGGSRVTGTVKIENGSFDLSGGSRLEIQGTAAGIKIKADNAGEIDVARLPVATADVALSGGSHAIISVTDIMNVNLSSASVLEYIGNPKLGSMKMSGGSTLNQIE